MSIEDLVEVRKYCDQKAEEQAALKSDKEADHDRMIRLAKEVAYRDVGVFVGRLITGTEDSPIEESDSRMDHA